MSRRAWALFAAVAVGCWTSEEATVRPSCPPPETAPAIDKRGVARIETATFALG